MTDTLQETVQEPIPDEKCGFCRRRGEACIRHGGVDSQLSFRKRQQSQNYRLNQKAENARIDAIPLPKVVPFVDRYGCSMCCRKEALCDMHEKFERDYPPTAAKVLASSLPSKPAVASGIKTTEQTVGEFRIVQIKVGAVVISIKEPLGAAA